MRSAPPPLDRFIELLWYWEGDPTVHLKDTIVASASIGLQINLAEDHLTWYDGADFSVPHRIHGIGISGPSSGVIAIDAYHRQMMGVKFRDGGAWPFFGSEAHAFADRHMALEDVWGADAERLHQRLVQAPTPDDKFDILLCALMAKAPERIARHPAVELALLRFSTPSRRISVAAVAREADLSQKSFIRVFSAQVGMRPKLYLRIARFQRVLRRISVASSVDWGDIVERHGYYDQSHFIRDFGQFTALTPGIFLKRRGPHLQHVPLPG